MEYAVAVIDIGMTNKKVAVYDDSLRQLDVAYHNFRPKIVDGIETHDLETMEEWFVAQIRVFAKKYPVKALAVTTHGGTFICLEKNGRNALPCVYYTHEPGGDFHKTFHDRFGSAQELQARTGTPAFKAFINLAKGILFVQEKYKEEFKNVSTILPYPQYWGFRFTGNMGLETTYMGSHTYLWDQVDNCFSTVARELGITSLMPDKLSRPWDALGTISGEFAAKTGLSRDTIVTMGIHDSNSALLPHFAKKGDKGFILNSTGTWCVIMNPVERYGFAQGELGKMVFFNISSFGKPIKTAIFLGGVEFETWSRLILKRHRLKAFPGWNENIYRTILKERTLFLLPELTTGTGQFPFSRARIVENGTIHFHDAGDFAAPCFTEYEKFFAALRLSLVMQTLTALERVGIRNGYEVYTEGGFRNDESYNRLLASALPDNRVFITNNSEASALGAAMTAKMALSGKPLTELADDFELCYQKQEENPIPELEAYRRAWLEEVEK